MIKAFIVSFAVLIALMLVIWSGILELISSSILFYIALILVVSVVVMAFIILGNPLDGLKDNGKNSN